MGKRGRPKKKNVERTERGRISRAKGANAENVEPFEVRMRRLGLSYEDARDQKAQSVHGLMFLRKQIRIEQYDAGEEMFKLRRDYLKAIKAPNSMENGTGAGGEIAETDSYVEWSDRIKSRYADAMRAIQDAQGVHRMSNLWGAIDYMLYRNEHHRHMEGDFSTVLRVLAVNFGLTKNRKSDSLEDEIPRSQRCA